MNHLQGQKPEGECLGSDLGSDKPPTTAIRPDKLTKRLNVWCFFFTLCLFSGTIAILVVGLQSTVHISAMGTAEYRNYSSSVGIFLSSM